MATTVIDRQRIHHLAPGEIRHATVAMRLADGTTHEEHRDILLLDVRPTSAWEIAELTAAESREGYDGERVRVLWQLVSREGLPGGEPRWATLQLQSAEVGGGAVRLTSVGEQVGTYRPRDPQANSLEVLRDAAIARVAQLADWREHRPAEVAEAATAARVAEAEAKAAMDHRDQLIRAALDSGISAYALAPVVGLTQKRVGQIRNGSR